MRRINIIREFFLLSRRDKVCWVLASTGFIFLLYSFCYTLDTISILHYEWSFAHSIVEGKLSNFYEFPFQMMQFWNPEHCPTYDLPMNLLLGIWGLPMYAYSQVMGISDVYISFACRVYGKSIYIVALIISLGMIYKICRNLGESRERSWATMFIFLTSIMLLSGTAIAGQTDIIGISIALGGLKAYMEGKHGLFVFLFMLAFPFKQYSFFVFVPLLVLKEKKLFRISLDALCVLLFTAISNIPIRNTPAAYEFKSEFGQIMFNGLVEQKLPFSNSVSSFLVLWGVLIVYCYLTDFQNLSYDKKNDYIVFTATAAMMSVFIGFGGNGYWYVNMVPYLALALSNFSNDCNHLVLIETIGMGSAMVNNIIKNYWVYDVTNMTNMLVDKLTGNNGYQGTRTLAKLVDDIELIQYATVFDSVFFVCSITILWLIFPGLEHVGKLLDDRTLRRQACIRGTVNYLIALIPVMIFLLGLL